MDDEVRRNVLNASTTKLLMCWGCFKTDKEPKLKVDGSRPQFHPKCYKKWIRGLRKLLAS